MRPFECPTCGADDAQCLDGLPCDRCAATSPPTTVNPTHHHQPGDLMKKTATITLAAVLLTTALAGCGGGGSDDTADTAAPANNTTKSGSSEDALRKAAQGYVDAFMSGNILRVSAYLPPECTDEDRGSMMMGLGMFKEMIGDSNPKMKVEEVSVTGGRGEVVRYSVSGDMPDELERLLMSDGGAPAEPERWKTVKGKWYRADCEG